ncbi:ISAs1 family transposase [Glutamicibacter uratoxydans]|uniref:ISAs1 family transposase n=1 Tax=Glutamicibacter uratoxydans TaxID=43667 RepID=UPI003D6E8321
MLSSLITLLQRQFTDATLATELHDPHPNGPLFTVLAGIKDPRSRRGIRHPLQLVLTLAIAAYLANHHSYTQMYEYVVDLWKRNPAWGEQFVHGPPSQDTFERVLALINPDELDTASSGWVASQLTKRSPGARKVVRGVKKYADFKTFSADGKESRSAKHGTGTRSHNLAAADQQTGAVLGQVAVREKSNEIPYLKNLLRTIDENQPGYLSGAVLTVDALHTQRDTAMLIRSYGCEYVMTVKGNQPSLQAECAEHAWEQIPVSDVIEDWDHGRYVRRELKLVQPVGALKIAWPWALQVGQLTRFSQRTAHGKTNSETVYVVTSLAPGMANVSVVNRMLVNHWGIENKVHWVRDVGFNEDKNQIRRGTAARVAASLANLVLSLLRLAGFDRVAESRRRAGRDPEFMAGLLLGEIRVEG